MAIAYATEIGAMYLETSAKDDSNVHDIFVKLSKYIRYCTVFVIFSITSSMLKIGQKLPAPPQVDPNTVRATANIRNSQMRNQQKSGGCCWYDLRIFVDFISSYLALYKINIYL